MPLLGVNIDHVATIRQARREFDPDPVQAALICQKAGADSIVAHLREDRRHINDNDVVRLKIDMGGIHDDGHHPGELVAHRVGDADIALLRHPGRRPAAASSRALPAACGDANLSPPSAAGPARQAVRSAAPARADKAMHRAGSSRQTLQRP